MKAFTSGCAGASLSVNERRFFADERPWGLILFARNIVDAGELCDLVADFRDAVARPDAPVLIDQEGGRVQRLRPPLAPDYPSNAELGALYARNSASGTRAAYLLSRLHAFDLQRFGIDIDCLPVLDVPTSGAHQVIGSRAYGRDPECVAAMGRAACEGLLHGGVLPVLKHLPGHGRGPADSHKSLPRVDASVDELRASDFVPFIALNDMPIGMTAHVVYEAIDPDYPGTTSSIIVNKVIRGEIGFSGLLLSDDVSMNALSGDAGTRTRDILNAGCDIALHCNGVFEEMRLTAANARDLEGTAQLRAKTALARRGKGDQADEATLRAEFEALTGTNVSLEAA